MRFGLWTFLAGVFLFVGQATADDNPVLAGADEFRVSCAACHGMNGEGEGPLAIYLNVPPANLTTITQRNNGVFPSETIHQIIDGRAIISPHGDRQMPVWGDRYLENTEARYGAFGNEQAVHGRIDELVAFIKSIQVN